MALSVSDGSFEKTCQDLQHNYDNILFGRSQYPKFQHHMLFSVRKQISSGSTRETPKHPLDYMEFAPPDQGGG